MKKIRRIAALKTVDEFRAHLRELGIELPLDDQVVTGGDSPVLQPVEVWGRKLGNRYCVHAMEGWDATPEGGSTEPMIRRWRKFGESGAKLIWGGEAMAVDPEGRANANQLILNESNLRDIAGLRDACLDEHRKHWGNSDDMLIGFQLTHSGRFSRPRGKLEARVAYRHPILDKKFHVSSDEQVMSDGEIRRLIDDYVKASVLAQKAGADFVDIKHCHGYLLHEFLGAHTRDGDYGGSFENRTRILREIVSGIRSEAKGLEIGVRLSAFDFVPFRPDPAGASEGKLGPGIPEDYSHCLPYRYGFGVNHDNPLEMDLTDPPVF